MNNIEKFLVVALTLAVVGGLAAIVVAEREAALQSRPWQEKKQAIDLDAYKASLDNCTKRGGVIIRSGWDGRVVDCK